MAFYSYVAFVTSKEGEAAFIEAVKNLDEPVRDGVQSLLRTANRNAVCDDDTLRIWGPVIWYDEHEEVQFFKAFLQENCDAAYLIKLTPGDYGTHEENFGSYLENAFELTTDTSFFYYEDGKPKSTALMAYDHR